MISKFENNESVLSVEQAKYLAKFLETSVSYLIEGEENISKEKYKELQAKYEREHEKYVALLESKQGGNTTTTAQLGDNNFNAQNFQK